MGPLLTGVVDSDARAAQEDQTLSIERDTRRTSLSPPYTSGAEEGNDGGEIVDPCVNWERVELVRKEGWKGGGRR